MADDCENDESHRLLDEESNTSEPSPSFLVKDEPDKLHRKSWASSWTIIFGIAVAVLLALFTTIRLLNVDPKTTTTTTIPPRQIAIPLHPGKHTSRAPTTLEYHWNITLDTRSPDGVQKAVYLVNDEFPGPTIEARSGDRILVHVHNGLESEGISLHWHGLQMKGHNAMDGALGFTQCALNSGQDFTYDFKIGDHEHGTFWWHSHAEVQRGDGLYGGLVVHEPGGIDNYDEVLLLAGDWFHRKQTDILEWYHDWKSLGNEPVPDSLVLNGHGRFDCAMALPSRPLECADQRPTDGLPLFAKQPRRPVKLRVVNTGTVAGLSFGADTARLQPIAVDGGFPVNGVSSRSFGILYPGERTDVLVHSDVEGTEESRFHIYLDKENFAGMPNPSLTASQSFLLFSQGNGDAGDYNTSTPPLNDDNCDLSTLTATLPSPTTMAPKAQQTILLYLKSQILAHNGNRPLGFFNHTSWEMQTPPLIASNRSSWNSHQLVHFIGTDTDAPYVDIVLNNLDDGSHPIHLHGYSFMVLSSFRAEGRNGWGSYNPYSSPPPGSVNLRNPVVKDTVSVPRRGHVVIRIKADNPGLWMMHCHMLVHMGTGMVTGLHVAAADDFNHTKGKDESATRLCKGVSTGL